MTAPARDRPVRDRLARPPDPLAARDRGDRLDRHVVLLRRCSTSRSASRRTSRDREAGVGGELWEVHGGGFYHVQKYRVAPQELPDHLAWFKWEAYTTWLSGFGLMVVLYYLNAHTYLIDPSVADLDARGRRSRSASALLAAAWVVYDVLCRAARRTRARARRLHPRADRARRLGLRAALRAAGGVPPGRRDARDDHGRQRRLQHHPGALGADPREARPGATPTRRPDSTPSAARCTTTT